MRHVPRHANERNALGNPKRVQRILHRTWRDKLAQAQGNGTREMCTLDSPNSRRSATRNWSCGTWDDLRAKVCRPGAAGSAAARAPSLMIATCPSYNETPTRSERIYFHAAVTTSQRIIEINTRLNRKRRKDRSKRFFTSRLRVYLPPTRDVTKHIISTRMGFPRE